jgi:hypothetical protein
MRFTAPAWTTLALVDHLCWHPSFPIAASMAALYAIRPLDRKPQIPEVILLEALSRLAVCIHMPFFL